MTHDVEPARVVLDSDDISRALTRLAHEVVERTHGADNLTIIGIPTRGASLAVRLAAKISAIQGRQIPCGALDVTMYRDDLRMRPARALLPTTIPSEGIEGRLVVLVDDVLFSGRTIRADYVGKNLPTSNSEAVQVRLVEHDGVDEVSIERAQ